MIFSFLKKQYCHVRRVVKNSNRLMLAALRLSILLIVSGLGVLPTKSLAAENSDQIIVEDVGFPDVGVPGQLQNAGFELSGWDIRSVSFGYNGAADLLTINIDCYGICGDADGDGDSDSTSSALAGIGGQDQADFAGTESIALEFDIDLDGLFDLVVGVPGGLPASGSALANCTSFSMAECFGIYDHADTVSGSLAVAPAFRFAVRRLEGAAISKNNLMDGSDLQIDIPNWSSLLARVNPQIELSPCASFSVDVRIFAGSFEDAGVGEDFIPNPQTSVRLDFPEVRLKRNLTFA